jgi:glycosyltransferase involved in cell wall biosynthesis
MRILHAYNQHRSGGGATAVTQTTIDLLKQRGHDVEVFTRRSIDLPKSIKGHLLAAASAFTGGGVPEFDALLEKFRPEVVHAHELFPLITPWILPACRKRGVPVVVSWNDYHMTCPARNHFKNGEVCTRCVGGHEYWSVLRNCRDSVPESVTMALYCTMFRKFGLYTRNVDHYSVLSPFTRTWLIEQAGIAPDRVTSNPPVVPIPDCPADPPQGRYVAFGGRFVPEKGIDTLIEASRISGIPVQLSRNAEHFVTIDLPPGVETVVTRGREDLESFYRGARIVAMPSRWFETFGVVAAEGMALGIPVVVAKLGAMTDLIEHGISGLFFEPGNARDLAKALSTLWSDPGLCAAIGRAGRQRAIDLWSASRHYDTAIEIYEKAIAARSMERPG